MGKQFDIKATREIDGNMFYIRPFPAFTAVNMSGDIAALITPILATIAPVLGGAVKDGMVSVMDIEAETAATALATGMTSISGDKIESLIHKLLTKYKNITVEIDGKDGQILTSDLANEMFCGNVEDLFLLVFDVIKVNFGGFFRKLGGPFGGVLKDVMQTGLPSTKNTEL